MRVESILTCISSSLAKQSVKIYLTSNFSISIYCSSSFPRSSFKSLKSRRKVGDRRSLALDLRLTSISDLDEQVKMHSRRKSPVMFLLVSGLRLSFISCNANSQLPFNSLCACIKPSTFCCCTATYVSGTKCFRHELFFKSKGNRKKSVRSTPKGFRVKKLKASIKKDLADVMKKQRNDFLVKKAADLDSEVVALKVKLKNLKMN